MSVSWLQASTHCQRDESCNLDCDNFFTATILLLVGSENCAAALHRGMSRPTYRPLAQYDTLLLASRQSVPRATTGAAELDVAGQFLKLRVNFIRTRIVLNLVPDNGCCPDVPGAAAVAIAQANTKFTPY